ncbi:MAG: hypothetical protein R3C59_30570 [Planctomycetaceae bacterium]
MKTIRNLVCLTLMVLVAGSVMADEKGKKGKGKKGAAKKPTPTQRFVGKLELTDEQKEQVAAIDKQFGERFGKLQKEMNDLLTDEQKKAQREAQKSAKADGTKGGEARKALEAALNLTDEQKAKRKEQLAAQQKLNGEIIAALKKVLTEEQQASLPKAGGPGKGGKGKKKKDAA